MGWFDGTSDVGSTSHHHRKSSSSKHGGGHHRSSTSPRASSIFGLGIPEPSSSHRSHSRTRSAHGDKPRGPSTSFFGLGEPSSGGKSHSHSHHDGEKERERMRSIFGTGDGGKHNSNRSSFFGFGGGRSSSYYKRSPRSGYLKRVYSKLRRLLRDLIYYMKKNPMKVFMLVIMPLITGGALTTLLAKFGMRLPPGVAKMFGGNQGGRGGGGGSSMEWEHSKVSGPLGAMGGLASVVGGMGGDWGRDELGEDVYVRGWTQKRGGSEEDEELPERMDRKKVVY